MSNHRRPVNALFAAALPVLLLAGATAAQAHMPYVLPTLFDAGKADHVTVTSAFAEDAFVPEVAMRDAPFHLVAPDGSQAATGPVTYLRDLSVFEAEGYAVEGADDQVDALFHLRLRAEGSRTRTRNG